MNFINFTNYDNVAAFELQKSKYHPVEKKHIPKCIIKEFRKHPDDPSWTFAYLEEYLSYKIKYYASNNKIGSSSDGVA